MNQSVIDHIRSVTPKGTRNRRKEGRNPSARQPRLFLEISAIALTGIIATAIILTLISR
jgi:hypothetical protein